MRFWKKARPESDPARLEWGKLAFDLLKVEYDSIRTESAHSRQAQQSILQWSLAVMGVVFTAGVLLTNSMAAANQDDVRRYLYAFFLFLYGLALPAAAWFSCMAWFGELIRMERAGRYLRGLECVISDVLNRRIGGSSHPGEHPYLCAPLRWETYIANENMRGIAVSKQRVGYLGSLGLYTGALGLPLAVFCVRVWLDPVFWDKRWQQTLLTVHALLLLIAFTVTVAILVVALQRAGREVPDITKVVPNLAKVVGDPMM